MSERFIIGAFEDESPLFKVIDELNAKKIPIYDIYSPFPVHGLDEKMGIRRSFLPYITFAGGLLGFILALYFQYWTSVTAWPVNVGGKSFNSLPAFIPVTFEIMVLLGGLISVGSFFYIGRLYPGKKTEILHSRVTNDHFVVAIKSVDASIDIESVKDLFTLYKADEIKVINKEEEC